MKRWIAWVIVLLLAACGGGGSGDEEPAAPAPTEVAAGQSVQQNIGAAGGSVSLATREGALFALSLPAGAVGEGTALSLSSAAVSAGQRFHLRLAPAGLVLAQGLQATLTITLPAAMALPAGALLVYDGVPLPYTRLADGRLQLLLSHFAGAAAAVGQARPLAASTLADAEPACRGVPGRSEGGLTGADPIEADLYGQCMVDTVNRLAASGGFADAVRVAGAVGAYLQSIGAANTDQLAGEFADRARSITCTQLYRVLDNAANGRITGMGSLHALVRPVLFWENTRQRLGARCPDVASSHYVTVIEALTTDAIRFYASKQGAIVDAQGVEYTEAVSEAKSGNQTVSQVRALQAPPALQQLAQTQTEQRAQPALLDAMLQAPWQRCRDSGNFDKLIELMDLLRQPPAVKAAAQYCATQLQARALNANGQATATLQPTLGGVRAAELHPGGTLSIAKDGRLELTGPIRALQCPAGQTGGSESLQLKLGSTVLQTLTSAPYLATPLTIDMPQALQAAGITPADFRGATLTLTRSGSPCNGFWGDNPQPLLTLELSGGACVPEPGRNWCVSVLADLDSTDADFHAALAISHRGGHIVLSSPQGSGTRWSVRLGGSGGRTVPFPDGFEPWGLGPSGGVMAIADDGAVVGGEATYLPDAVIDTFLPGLFDPATRRLRRLLPAPVKAFDSIGGTAIDRRLVPMTISPQGRVTFTVVETSARSDADLGFCGSLFVHDAPPAWECVRYTRYEASAGEDGSATASVKQVLSAPGTGELPFIAFDGGSEVGRLGFNNELVAEPGPLGGIGRYKIGGFPQAAREGVAEQPAVRGVHVAGDRFGRTISELANGVQLRPAHAAVPAGWTLGSLGIEGLLQVCSHYRADIATTRLIDLGSGQALIELAPGTAVTHQGRRVMLSSRCGYPVGRAVDALGRMLGYGLVDGTSREVPLVFTPAGVALP